MLDAVGRNDTRLWYCVCVMDLNRIFVFCLLWCVTSLDNFVMEGQNGPALLVQVHVLYY